MFSCLRNEDAVVCLAPAEGASPISLFDVETKAFPCHFPDGHFGIAVERDAHLGMHQYFNVRLFSKDNRFAADPEYVFYALDFVEKKAIFQSTSIAFRKAAPSAGTTSVTAGMLRDETQRQSIFRRDVGFRFLETLRGSPAYWNRTLRDLFAMLRQLGIPTWFCSFSAADRRWVEIPSSISQQQQQPIPDTLSWTEHCRLINSNPVTACRMFERVRLFIESVLKSPSHPIGEIEDYFIRSEFQSRGWPHIHAIF
jgi:hypothetical protein